MSTFGGPGKSSSLLHPSPARRRVCKIACWLLAVSLWAVAAPSALAVGMRITRQMKTSGKAKVGIQPRPGLCRRAGWNVSDAVAAAHPAISPTCSQVPNSIQWNDTNPNTEFILLSLFHQRRSCRSTFRVQPAHPPIVLNLDMLTNRLPTECQRLGTPWIAIQRCGDADNCGPVHGCLQVYCGLGPVAARIHGNVKRTAVVLRLNTFLTSWPDNANGYHVLRRDQNTGIRTNCSLQATCKRNKQKCFLKCRGLTPCTRYAFCPFMSPSPNWEANRSRCDDPHRYWRSAATRPTVHQGKLLSSMKVSTVRLNGDTVMGSLQGGMGKKRGPNPSISARVCLNATTDTYTCQSVTFTASKQRDNMIVFSGLSALAGYTVSGQICLGCDSAQCVAVKSELPLLQPNRWLVTVIEQVAISPAAGVASVQPFRLDWAQPFDLCTSQCAIVASVQCENALPHQQTVSADQRTLKVDWKSILPSIGNQEEGTCRIWLSVLMDKNSSREQQIPISSKLTVGVQVLPTELGSGEDGNGAGEGTSSRPATDHQDSSNPVITIVLSTVFSVATIVVLALILRFRYCRSSAALGDGDDSRRLLDRTLARREHLRRHSSSGCKHGHDYEKLKSVRNSLARKKAAEYGSGAAKVTSAPAAPPPVPNAPRPIHILPRACSSQSPPSSRAFPATAASGSASDDTQDYDRLFAADSGAGTDGSSRIL